MKTRLFIALAVVMGLSIGSVDAQIRERSSKARIHQGVRSGELTRFERQHLKREQRKIQRHKRHFRRNDGRISPRERRYLMNERKQHSRKIYRLKHNRFERS
jgi:hypothetical protein